MPPSPSITVLMAIQNAMPYLPQAIESILQQSWSDFDFLIVDDHSTDDSLAYLQNLKDPRIRLLSSTGKGQTAALNQGLKQTHAAWIARMDGDDWSAPTRLEEQWHLVQQHPQAVFVSTDYMLCDEALKPVASMNLKTDDPGFLNYFHKRQNPFCHSTMMFRRDAAHEAGNYSETMKTAQDYALWMTLLERGSFCHVPKVLLKYRVRRDAVSIVRFTEQNNNRRHVLGQKIAAPTAFSVGRHGMYAYRLGFGAWIGGDHLTTMRYMAQALLFRARMGRALAILMFAFLPRRLYLHLTGYDHVFR